MICEKCKHEVGPEEEKCPYCGAVNLYAVQHKQNMRLFKKRYEDTEKEVTGFARAVEGLGKKAAILVMLLIGIITMTVITSLNYADPDGEKKVRRDAVKNAAAYAGEAEGFLERGEYVEFVSFLYAHELMNFPPDEFKRFQNVMYVAKEYYECIELMEEIILRSDDPDYHDGLDTDIKNFCMYVDGFYEVLKARQSMEKDELYLSYIKDMENELHAAMRTYFSMDEKGVNEFLSLSRAQKAVKLSEVVRHE
ncbi:MAG: hypothetical protein K6F87_03675 [Lachnospiraceae bacterium]|nr:hypothetical protein [Lachnospiraceae bacterium]